MRDVRRELHGKIHLRPPKISLISCLEPKSVQRQQRSTAPDSTSQNERQVASSSTYGLTVKATTGVVVISFSAGARCGVVWSESVSLSWTGQSLKPEVSLLRGAVQRANGLLISLSTLASQPVHGKKSSAQTGALITVRAQLAVRGWHSPQKSSFICSVEAAASAFPCKPASA